MSLCRVTEYRLGKRQHIWLWGAGGVVTMASAHHCIWFPLASPTLGPTTLTPYVPRSTLTALCCIPSVPRLCLLHSNLVNVVLVLSVPPTENYLCYSFPFISAYWNVTFGSLLKIQPLPPPQGFPNLHILLFASAFFNIWRVYLTSYLSLSFTLAWKAMQARTLSYFIPNSFKI